MKHLVSILFAYLLACPLTERVSLDVMQTEWTNILTYIWIACAGLIWVAIAFVAVLIFAGIAEWWSNR